jgi:hypothetical protein
MVPANPELPYRKKSQNRRSGALHFLGHLPRAYLHNERAL